MDSTQVASRPDSALAGYHAVREPGRGTSAGVSGSTGFPALPRKVIEGLRRYGPLELMATAATLLGAYAAYRATGSAAAAALAGTIAENVGYYGAAGLRSSALWYGALPQMSPGRRLWMSFWHAVRATMVEFGPAEIVSLLLRPPLLYATPLLLGSMGAGWVIGKILADIVFYAMAYVSLAKARHLIVPATSTSPAVR